MVPRGRILRGLLGAGLATSVLLTGACGADEKTAEKAAATAPSSAPPASPVPADNGLAAMPPAEFLAAVTAAVKQTTSVRIKGAMTETGTPMSLDMRIGTDRAQGTITGAAADDPTAAIELICVDGKEYIKGKEFWASSSAEAAEKIGDKWALMPSEGENANAFGPFCSMSAMADNILKPTGTPTKGSASTVNGQQVATLVDTDGGAFFAASTGAPLVVRISDSVQQKENVDFTEWNAPLMITAPTDVVDVSTMGE